ncbi:DUF397 domain-containing protein [Streptomyces hiroshimensis]|uniref:DUF397 domain-containing protein n=1 Tax=Streptomyces hiroshimensis TaxID=66424 RepID=A0ABQ2YIX2_9ACTN|nr:DUF397 domain-containing protein [Streptomyces hiroshimensis]GGX85544.1 hypothetical protein GCM10010324_34230 [Streptomyces hiroshimensis]
MITWQKSTYSGTGDGGNDCVEVAAAGEAIALRESDTPATVVRATPRALGTLIRTLKAGTGRG